MSNPNDQLPVFPSYDAPGGHGALLDHVQTIKQRDFADDDVRAAMREVAEKEKKHRLAEDLGLDGVTAAESWDRRIESVGPRAALEAGELYRSQPRTPIAVEDGERDDHIIAARAAFKQAQLKEERAAHMPRAIEALDRLKQRHGSLDVVSDFKKWDAQLRENPADAAPRVAREIANRINESVEMQSARHEVNSYTAQNRITPEERTIMQKVLEAGEVSNLPAAHAYARYLSAADVKHEHERSVTSAQRAREGAQTFFAKVEVARFEQAHPDVARGPIRNRMRELLQNGTARSMDQAYQMATKR
jgi:hypothetical protein